MENDARDKTQRRASLKTAQGGKKQTVFTGHYFRLRFVCYLHYSRKNQHLPLRIVNFYMFLKGG
nr:MAG TPA: hypothetical protein [Bacteriophage sp.]